jgi:hypothetical protein
LKLFCYAEKFDCKFRLFAKMLIDSEGLFGIDMRHLEVMLYMGQVMISALGRLRYSAYLEH